MKTTKPYRFIISGGGTGGHIFPAVSIAKEIKRRMPDAEILFAGAEGKMEMERVPREGFAIKGLPIAGWQRKWTWKNLSLPYKIFKSLSKALELIRDFRPDAVIGTGGYASAPVVWAAQFKGIPTFIQEQNSYPGLTNRFLGRKAIRIFTAYDEAAAYFPKEKVIKTGNPVRPGIQKAPGERDRAIRALGWDPQKPVILILGGSLGAAPVNEAAEKLVGEAAGAGWPYQILWQTGKRYSDRYAHYDSAAVKVVPFITDMAQAYAAADVVVSRAGAGTLSELAVAGKPAILIPSTHVAADHQTKNARAFQKAGAAVVIPETKTALLTDTVRNILTDQKRWQQMSEAMRTLARPRATADIVDTILETLQQNKKKTANPAGK